MFAAATVPTTQPTPAAADPPSRVGRLLDLVRKLIDYGRELAETVRQRAGADPAFVRRAFGTTDIALILARITLGLARAGALEARLLRNGRHLDADSVRSAAPAPRTPRTAPPVARRAAEPDADLARLPTPEQITADVVRKVLK